MFNTYKQDNSLLLSTGYKTNTNSSTTSVTYNPREEVETVTWNTNGSLSSTSYTRDFLRRIQSSSYQTNNNTILNTTYNYLELDESKQNEGDDVTTNVLKNVVNTYNNTTDTYSYTFDNVGNISSITNTKGNTTYTNTYVYDSLNQLIRENNQELNKTYTFNYDNGGNLLEAKTYNYTTGTVSGTPLTTETYGYNDSSWKDLLTSYNGNPITYDNIGNPLTYHDGKQFTWSFRRLEQIVDGTKTYSYTYNQDGIRTSKTVGTITTNYIVSGNKILQETNDNYTIIYEYDALGNASSFVYNGTRYIYVRNGTNDVVGILNSSGSLVASYTYDGWGNVEVENHTTDTIGNINPIRYRSYYYDVETGYYYLNSRYYDSKIGRFINPDTLNIIDVNYDYNDKNLYSYCDNNPVNRQDRGGDCWIVSVLVGVGAQYASDVINNLIEGKRGTEVLVPTSSIGTYIAAGVTSLIPGGGIGKSVIRNTISEGIKTIEKVINKEIKTEEEIIVNFTSSLVQNVVYDLVTDPLFNKLDNYILDKTPKNYSSYAKKIGKEKYNLTQKTVQNRMELDIRINYLSRRGINFFSDVLGNII